MSLPMPIQVAADTSFPLPVLNCADVSIGRQDGGEPSFNIVLCTEFKTLHASNDLSVELFGTEGFSVEHVDVGRATEPTTYPRMVHHFG
jgi:hypothetical protein